MEKRGGCSAPAHHSPALGAPTASTHPVPQAILPQLGPYHIELAPYGLREEGQVLTRFWLLGRPCVGAEQ